MKKEEESVPPPAVDPRLCCAAQICCDNPDNALRALIELLEENVTTNNPHATGGDVLRVAASWIFNNFDLAPKGTATRLYKSLRPWFDQAKKKEGKD